MKFRAVPVTSLEDATLDFEQLQTRDILDLTAESVLQLAVTGSKRVVSVGAQLITFTASTVSNSPVVTHGLGRLPIVVVATSARSPILCAVGADTYTTTQFTLQGEAFSAATGTVPVQWIAVG